jgi:phosphatidylserine decarboxylase
MCRVSQTQGIGTIRSHQHGPEYEDDGLSSDEADGQEGEVSDDDDEAEPKSSTPDDSNVFTPRSFSSSPDLTPTPSPTAASQPPTQQARYFLPSIPKILTRRPVRSASTPLDTLPSPQSQSTSTSRLSSVSAPTARRRKKIPGPWHGQKSGTFELEADNDIVGIVMLEIHSATDLPRLRNSELLEPLPHRRLIGFESDAYRVGYGPFRGRLIRQEGLSNAHHPTFA